MPRRAFIIALAVAIGSAVAALFVLVRAETGLITTHDGPYLTMRSTSAYYAAQPGVVVAHGFAGSAQLMRGFGDTLARRGFVVVLLDFAGHGGNTASQSELGPQIDAAVAHLRSRPGVDRTRISLIGHSMGAGAVTRYAATHSGIQHTVAISLGDGDVLPDRLLLIVGQLEFRHFRDVATEAVAASGGQRRVVVVPATEHISVLFATRTHQEILGWLGVPPEPTGVPWLRLLGGGLLVLAFAAGMFALIRPRLPAPEAPIRLMLAAPAAALIAVSVSLVLPQDLLPLAVGGYVAVFVAIAGIAMATWAHLGGHRPRSGGLSLFGLALIGYPISMTLIPIHFGLTHALPTGPRWWLLPGVIVAFGLLSYGTLMVTGGRMGRLLLASGAVSAVLVAAAVAGLAPGFLLLILPLLAVLLGWQAVWMALLTRTATPAWLVALSGAILPAWPIATAMPLTG